MHANFRFLVHLAFLLSLHLQSSSVAVGQVATQSTEYLSGLIGDYRFQGQKIQRIDTEVNFAGTWKPNEQSFIVDDRFPSGPLQVVWHGELQVREEGLYHFNVYGEGRFKLTLDGQLLIDGSTSSRQWLRSSSPTSLAFGKHPIQIEYSTADAEPSIGLYWSGPSFGLEPLSAEYLTHDASEPIVDLHARGRELSRALRCTACHDFQRDDTILDEKISQNRPQLSAPALSHVKDNLRPSWLVKRLTSDQARAAPEFADSRMPHFALHRNDAAAIVAALFAASLPSAPPENLAEQVGELKKNPQGDLPARDTADAVNGRVLFSSRGCVACHQVPVESPTPQSAPGHLPTESLFSGGDLSNIAAKRPPEFYLRWLHDAATVNPDHRMPVFELSLLERHDLAAYLATLGIDNSANDSQPFGDAIRGTGLIQQHRCGACHALPESLVVAGSSAKKSRVTAKSEWAAGCLLTPQATKFQPGFNLAEEDLQALRSYLTDPTWIGTGDSADQLLAENNCLNCHGRGGQPGISTWIGQLANNSPELAPRLAAIVPPSLNSVGDKLNEEALAKAINRTEPMRRTWLDVQMPKVKLTEKETEAIVAGLVSRDRIPDDPQAYEPNTLDALTDQQVALLAGRLVTAEGFGCQSCHQIADSIPVNVALNARGSDLTQLGERIRPSWFRRWVRNPARIVPRMEMPAIQVAAPGILHDSLDSQLAALWRTLNTEGFQPPKANAVRIVRHRNDPSSHAPAHVLTDVIEMAGKSYLRPLVIGLPNRHNLLFDLEKGELATWWIGDTGHQHTRGKSWYWATGSAPIIPNNFLERIRVLDDNGELLQPQIVGQVAVELDAIKHDGAGVTWSGTLHLASEHRSRTLSISQRFASPEPATGTVRTTLAGLQASDRVFVESSGKFDDGSTRAGTSRIAHFDSVNSVEVVSPHFADRVDNMQQLTLQAAEGSNAIEWTSTFKSRLPADSVSFSEYNYPSSTAETLDCVPGYRAVKLPLPINEMPIAFAWNDQRELFVGSLKGRVLKAVDRDGDGEFDQYQRIGDEFPTPYGLFANRDGTVDALTKFGLLRLSTSSDGPVWNTQVIADGWGYTSDYHDWAVGLRKDQVGNYWMTLPCQQDQRSEAAAHLRGHALKLIPNPESEDRRLYRVESYAAGLRFPMGLALNDADELFTSDNQGNFNPFNELNHVRQGKRYGFINQLENKPGFNPPFEAPAVNLPHPWTRSVNGICFLRTPKREAASAGESGALFGSFEGHLLGCEMNGRSLIRMSLQKVGDTYQGAAYPFSRPVEEDEATFEGPIVCEVSPEGDIYVGNLKDSGWGGGQNTGSIVRLTVDQCLPLGIAEVRATGTGFEIDFTRDVDPVEAVDPKNYSLRSYVRVATPAYGGDDQDEQAEAIQSITLSDDHRRVVLELPSLRAGAVYELNVAPVGTSADALFPAQAHYTMRQIP